MRWFIIVIATCKKLGDNIEIDPKYEKDKNTCYFDRN